MSENNLRIPRNRDLKSCFNNCDPYSNGESMLLSHLLESRVVFDVGCRSESIYVAYDGEVHYFDPIPEYISKLSKVQSNNASSFFNNFGLSSDNTNIEYYSSFESFHDRSKSVGNNSFEKTILQVVKASDYATDKQIRRIHLLKIDVEGHELEVLKGFDEKLRDVDHVQFEYGGTYLDAGISLRQVIDYLSNKDFTDFCYLNHQGLVDVHTSNESLADHYQYSNIVCFNKNTK